MFLICLGIQIVSWIMLLEHHPSLSLSATQTLFGLPISYDFSMALMTLEGALIFLSGAGIALIGL